MALQVLPYYGGLNTKATAGTLPGGSLLTCDNFFVNGASLTLRNNAFQIGTVSGGQFKAHFYYIVGSGSEFFMLLDVFHSRVYALGNPGSLTNITGAASLNTDGTFDLLNGVLFYGDFTGLYKWSGAGNIVAVGGNSLAISPIIKVVNNFLFASGGSSATNYSQVAWSNVGDGTTWTVANTLNFRGGDGDPIGALSSLANDLIIFKTHSIGRLTTQTVTISGAVTLGPLTTIAEGIGTLGRNTVDHLPDGRIVFWATDNHVYIFDGSTFTDISDQNYPGPSIQPSLDSVLIGQNTSFVRVYSVRSEVWIASVNSNTFIYNYKYNTWSTRTANNTFNFFQCFSSGTGFQTVNSASTGVLNRNTALLAGDYTGNIYLEDSTAGSRAAPTSTVEFSVPVPADTRPNYVRFFVIPLQSASVSQTVLYYTGRDGTYGSSTSFTTTGGWDRLKIAIPSSSQVTYFQVKLTYSTFVSITLDPAYVAEEAVQ